MSIRIKSKNNRGDFFVKVVLFALFIGISFWGLVNFVVTTPAADIKKNAKKLDNDTAYLKGKITRLGYFAASNTAAFELKTRKGTIWVSTKKDYPAVGSNMFIEATVYGSGKTFWTRFATELKKLNKKKWDKKARGRGLRCEIGDHSIAHTKKTKEIEPVEFPILYEMNRLSMPF